MKQDFLHSVVFKAFLYLFIFLLPMAGISQVRLPELFSDSMVLQHNTVVPVWGWAPRGERISVSIDEKEYRTRAGRDGTWQVKLEPLQAGGPYELIVHGTNTIQLQGILAGDVWFCSGQSNMAFPVKDVYGAEEELLTANFPEIRILEVPRKMSVTTLEDTDSAQWHPVTSATIKDFSAVAYFFAREIHHEIDVPVGLIGSYWGGTVSETWTSMETMEEDEDFARKIEGIPPADFNTYVTELDESYEAWRDSFDLADEGWIKQWYTKENMPQDWQEITLPGMWEQSIPAQMDGTMWFRKTFSLSSEEAANDAILSLGRIDDGDYTYVNGTLVGHVEDAYDVHRRYIVPAKILHPGVNTIIMRIMDYGGGGGMYGEEEEVYLQTYPGNITPLSGIWEYRDGFVSVAPSSSLSPNIYPSLLYNAMVHPFIKFPVKGIIWYQGESNAPRAFQYRRLFRNLIIDWREKWNTDSLPFLWVQLAGFREPDSRPGFSEWAELREAQTMALELPQTGQALALDIGDANDIHPGNKQEVGRRLALTALHVAYQRDTTHSGPVFKQMAIEGDKVRIYFEHIGIGLKALDKYNYLKGFTIAGADKVYHYAKAEIDGNSVIIWSDHEPNPVAVRYGWADNPDQANLYNIEGLPAVPFRTDNWRMITREGRF